jgi:hypothetical protein
MMDVNPENGAKQRRIYYEKKKGELFNKQLTGFPYTKKPPKERSKQA